MFYVIQKFYWKSLGNEDNYFLPRVHVSFGNQLYQCIYILKESNGKRSESWQIYDFVSFNLFYDDLNLLVIDYL